MANFFSIGNGTAKQLKKRSNSIIKFKKLKRHMGYFLILAVISMVILCTSSYFTVHLGRNYKTSVIGWLRASLKEVIVAPTDAVPQPFPSWQPGQPDSIAEATDNMLAGFCQQLTDLRLSLLKSNLTWIPTSPTTRFFDADSVPFFSMLQEAHVPTIQVKVSLNTLLWTLPWIGYKYSGNNCSLIENKSEYGNKATLQAANRYGQIYFNETCQNITATLKPIPFPKHVLDIGHLPLMMQVNSNSDEVTLTYLSVVRNAIVTQVGDVFWGHYKIIPQRCLPGKHIMDKPAGEQFLPLIDEVLAISQFWGEGYFHFMNEDLPRLAAWVPFLKQNPRIMIQVHSYSGFLASAFQMLGLGPERLTYGTVRAKILYLPAGTPCGAPAYFNSRLLSIRLQKAVPGYMANYTQPIATNVPVLSPPHNSQRGNDRRLDRPSDSAAENTRVPPPGLVIKKDLDRRGIVVIKRSEKRYFSNHNSIYMEIKRLAQKKGLNVELFSDRPLPEHWQVVKMFHNALAIVAPHGAGLSNMLYSQPGTIIIEGLCYHDNWANLCYRNLAKLLGHRYFGVLLQEQCTEAKPRDLVLPLKRLLESLNVPDIYNTSRVELNH